MKLNKLVFFCIYLKNFTNAERTPQYIDRYLQLIPPIISQLWKLWRKRSPIRMNLSNSMLILVLDGRLRNNEITANGVRCPSQNVRRVKTRREGRRLVFWFSVSHARKWKASLQQNEESRSCFLGLLRGTIPGTW